MDKWGFAHLVAVFTTVENLNWSRIILELHYSSCMNEDLRHYSLLVMLRF